MFLFAVFSLDAAGLISSDISYIYITLPEKNKNILDSTIENGNLPAMFFVFLPEGITV